MREVSFNVYRFDELSEEVQKRVIDRYQMNYDVSDELQMAMEDKFNGMLGELAYDYFKLSYSLNCCQGDGVSFTGTISGESNLMELAKLVYGENIPRNVTRLIKWDIIYDVKFDRINPHYVHSYTVDISVTDNYNLDCMGYSDNPHDRILEVMQDFEGDIISWYHKTCKELEDYGYTEIDFVLSDENIRDMLICNELEFTEDGRDF